MEQTKLTISQDLVAFQIVNRVLRSATFAILSLWSCWNFLSEAFADPGMPDFMQERMISEWSRPVYRSLRSVAYGNGTFVAVGPSLTILTSKDGVNWANHSSQINNVTANINFSTETYAANGDAITFALVNQSPSLSEIRRVPFQLRAVAFGAGTFVIVGDSGEILTSRDGEQWAVPSSGTSVMLTAVTWGNSGFVAVGDNGTILTSPDGSTWTKRNSGTEQTLFGVAYGNGTFVIVGDGSTILASGDGIEWTSTNIGLEAMEAIAFGNGIFMGTSIDTDFPGKIYSDNHQTMVSTDGKDWHKVRQPTPVTGASSAENSAESENGVMIELNGQRYRLNLSAKVGQFYEVQASTNLENWITLTTITNSGGILNFVDRDVTNYPMRFYRLKLQ